jgi:hypothetical protein
MTDTQGQSRRWHVSILLPVAKGVGIAPFWGRRCHAASLRGMSGVLCFAGRPVGGGDRQRQLNQAVEGDRASIFVPGM